MESPISNQSHENIPLKLHKSMVDWLGRVYLTLKTLVSEEPPRLFQPPESRRHPHRPTRRQQTAYQLALSKQTQ
jgi:hypothetical protein